MKISLNWLKKYVKIPEEVSNEDLIRLIGARLVEVEGVIDETHKYDNIFVVRVEKAEKIPDTHLTLCQINNGTEDLVQVVCGAPNVQEGMLAVWIAPGAVVPASVNEDAPFVIGKRKMQGYESSGMLAGADELDFGEDHSGIVEINPEDAQPGAPLADVFDLKDLILEIENKSLTHRPDTFGIIGFAREVAGILGQKFIEPVLVSGKNKEHGIPDVKRFFITSNKKGSANDINIDIISSEICQRYSAVVLEKHGEIKKKYLRWVDTILSRSGMKPISPIVDATNYLMLLTGQPLHAFDYNKFVDEGKSEKVQIMVRLAREGEKIVLLDDTEVTLNENDIVICSGDKAVALAGAMGGKSTMIDENTKNIIIESATFSLYNLRKTQMAHGIFSEAITRFTKGQSPYQTLDVAEACAGMLAEGFKVSNVADKYPKEVKDIVVKITISEINGLLGTAHDKKLIVDTLSNVGFIVKGAGEEIEVTAPKWRTDIHIKEDIIEEVGRLLGYDNIVSTLPLHGSAEKNKMLGLKSSLRQLMVKYGANELLDYSFVSEKLLKRAGQDPNNSFRVINSISPELQYIRQSIVPSLLEKTYLNEKLPVEKFAIFEMNKVYRKEWGLDTESVPVEKMSFGFVVAERKNNETAFYKAKKYAKMIFDEYNIDVQFVPLKNKSAETKPFELKRSAEILAGNQFIGVVGEFRNSVRNDFKLAPYLAGFEIDLDMLLNLGSQKKVIDLRKKETRDLTVSTTDAYGELENKIRRITSDAGLEVKILPLDIYQPEGEEKKNISVRLVFDQFDESVMDKLEKL